MFLVTQNFHAVKSYNPANTYALAILHLGDRIRGEGAFVQPFPGGERMPTLAEVQEIQRRLTALGFDTDGTDGRVGRDTMLAVRAYQRKVGLEPADGYAGLKVLARLRQGPITGQPWAARRCEHACRHRDPRAPRARMRPAERSTGGCRATPRCCYQRKRDQGAGNGRGEPVCGPACQSIADNHSVANR